MLLSLVEHVKLYLKFHPALYDMSISISGLALFHDNNAIAKEELYIIIQRKLGLMGVSHWVETIEHAWLMQEEDEGGSLEDI